MSADRLEIECHDGYIIVDGCEYHDHGDFVLGLVTAIRQQAGDIAELRAKTESSMSFKLWLEDMDENGDPIEWAIHGTSQDIGRMQARLGYLNDAVTEREQLRADLAAAVAARDWQIQATKAAIESCNQATTAGLAAVAERDQLSARLAAIEAAPVVAKVVTKIGPDEFPCGTMILALGKLRAGTELIARPAKDPTP